MLLRTQKVVNKCGLNPVFPRQVDLGNIRLWICSSVLEFTLKCKYLTLDLMCDQHMTQKPMNERNRALEFKHQVLEHECGELEGSCLQELLLNWAEVRERLQIWARLSAALKWTGEEAV